MKLGKIDHVDLRDIWRNEASDFTNWLSKEENISLLSDEIGIQLNILKTEASVGNFNVDILAEDEDGNKIIIENQLEITNHDHLGKIITYASGLDAKTIIWIFKSVRDEHEKAIEWLNDHTDEDINFFAIKVELWKINDSIPAPKFQIISKPNDWAKTVKKSVRESELTDTKLQQKEFWIKLIEYLKNNNTKINLRKPRPRHWYTMAIGSSKAHIVLTINTQENSIGCEIYIPKNKWLFQKLLKNKEKIEEEIKNKLEWMELNEKKASRIKISRDAYIENIEEWNNYHGWLKEMIETFLRVFPNYIKQAREE